MNSGSDNCSADVLPPVIAKNDPPAGGLQMQINGVNFCLNQNSRNFRITGCSVENIIGLQYRGARSMCAMACTPCTNVLYFFSQSGKLKDLTSPATSYKLTGGETG